MSDTHVYKVHSVNQSTSVVHFCGTKTYFCEVECSFADELYYCPQCDQFFETLDDYWYDNDTIWEAEKPTMIYHEGDELRKSITKLKDEIANLNQQVTKYMEILAQLVERDIVAKEAIDPIEKEIFGPE